MSKILVWDIESTSLKADFGYMLCVGYKWLGQKTIHCPTIDLRHRNPDKFRLAEKDLVATIREVLVEADMWVTYNGKRFDVPFVQCKLLEHGLEPLPNTPHVDLYLCPVRHGLATLSRKRLDTVSAYIGTSAEKSAVSGRIWVDAMMGSRAALRYIVRHCRADVAVLEEAYMRLRPLVRQHPRVSGFGPCMTCGGTRLQRRGRTLTVLRGPRVRLYCPDCGAWENRAEKDSPPPGKGVA